MPSITSKALARLEAKGLIPPKPTRHRLSDQERLLRQRPEKEAVAGILEYLALIPEVHVARFDAIEGKNGRWRQGGFRGCPDICGWVSFEDVQVRDSNAGFIFCAPTMAVPLYLEVKRRGPAGVRRGEQVAFIELARRSGCIAAFVTDVVETRAELRKWGVRAP